MYFAATLTVTILDVNDNFPEFGTGSYTFNVSENAVIPSIVAILDAFDRDLNQIITYSLNPGPWPTDCFSIDAQTGKYKGVQ